jgi:hypothetical protein
VRRWSCEAGRTIAADPCRSTRCAKRPTSTGSFGLETLQCDGCRLDSGKARKLGRMVQSKHFAGGSRDPRCCREIRLRSR